MLIERHELASSIEVIKQQPTDECGWHNAKSGPATRQKLNFDTTINSNHGQTIHAAVNEVLLYQQSMCTGAFQKQLPKASVNLAHVLPSVRPSISKRANLTGWILVTLIFGNFYKHLLTYSDFDQNLKTYTHTLYMKSAYTCNISYFLYN
jgi:hypothetical protein